MLLGSRLLATARRGALDIARGVVRGKVAPLSHRSTPRMAYSRGILAHPLISEGSIRP